MIFFAGRKHQLMFNKRLIINADDFGYNSEVNFAILTSFLKGLCSSTTIMANMPGFEEACQMSHDNGLTKCVGFHLVLSEGTPLTDKIKKCSRFCNSEGRFHHMGERHFFRLSCEEKNAVAQEISAQIDRCREYGIHLSHVDSHNHIHCEWGITCVLFRVMKNKGLRFIRLSRHLDPDSTFIKNLYRRLVNIRIILKGAAATKYFGTVEDFVRLKQNTNCNTISFEIMIHPTFNTEKLLIDDISNEQLDEYVARVVEYKKAISFVDIAKRTHTKQ